jgi:DNA ligase-1
VGRLALIKLITGGLRVGVSGRLARVALAEWSGKPVEEIEEIWHGVAPPYLPIFRWLEGEAEKPDPRDAPVFRPLMLAHPLEDRDLAALDPFGVAPPNGNGTAIRVQLTPGRAKARLEAAARGTFRRLPGDRRGDGLPRRGWDGELW